MSVTSTRDPIGMTPEEDDRRIWALRELDLLDTRAEDRVDRFVDLVKQLFGVETVGINLVDRDRQFTKARAGRLQHGDMPRSDSLCTYTVQGPDVLEIPDAQADPQWSDHPAVVGELGVRFYAGAPLRAPGGERIGALCLIDSSPRNLTGTEQEILTNLAGLVERELASSADLEQGREVQRRLLPRRAPDVPGWELGGACRQMGAVGGDFYDWQELDSEVQLMLCDVMGKGLSAALIAAGVRVVARGAAPYLDLAGTVSRVANDLSEDLEETGRFVTAFIARVDPATGRLSYVDAGHGLAFVESSDGAWRQLASDGLPLGALSGDTWDVHQDAIAPGEALVVVSDGLLDHFSGPSAMVEAVAPLVARPGPVDQAADDVARLVGRASDDVTVLVLRRQGAPA